MKLPQDVSDDLTKRLRRIEGQVRGIQQMLEQHRECRDVVAQVSAASKALDQVGFKLLATGLSHCLANPKQAAASGFDLDEVEKLFMKLA
ncbi:MAG: metal-sensitive transcriptional regulator [Ilumatobacteraceae bacterium]